MPSSHNNVSASIRSLFCCVCGDAFWRWWVTSTKREKCFNAHHPFWPLLVVGIQPFNPTPLAFTKPPSSFLFQPLVLAVKFFFLEKKLIIFPSFVLYCARKRGFCSVLPKTPVFGLWAVQGTGPILGNSTGRPYPDSTPPRNETRVLASGKTLLPLSSHTRFTK